MSVANAEKLLPAPVAEERITVVVAFEVHPDMPATADCSLANPSFHGDAPAATLLVMRVKSSAVCNNPGCTNPAVVELVPVDPELEPAEPAELLPEDCSVPSEAEPPLPPPQADKPSKHKVSIKRRRSSEKSVWGLFTVENGG